MEQIYRGHMLNFGNVLYFDSGISKWDWSSVANMHGMYNCTAVPVQFGAVLRLPSIRDQADQMLKRGGRRGKQLAYV